MPTKSDPGPQIKLYTALRSWFALDGVAYNVQTCNLDVFLRFIGSCRHRRSGKRRQIEGALLPLIEEEDDSDLARWYTICELLEGGYIVKLFSSEQEALQAIARTCIDNRIS